MLHYAYDRLARFWSSLIISYLKYKKMPRSAGSLCESFVTGTESVKTDISEPKIDTTWSTFYRIFSNLIRTSFCRVLKRKKKVSSRF